MRRYFLLLIIIVIFVLTLPRVQAQNPGDNPNTDNNAINNPLTGMIVDDPAVLNRAPLAVKISNAPAQVRPQTGLEQADLVYEHLTEGFITRLTAIFYTYMPERVGSIRSARLIDLELVPMYQALFAYSGASGPIRERIGNSVFASRSFEGVSVGEPVYKRDDTIEPPHNLFVYPALLQEQASALEINTPPQLEGLTFQDEPQPLASAFVNQINLDYGADTVHWEYDVLRQHYVRYINDEFHTDIAGNPLTTRNVVVIYAHHQPDYTIVESEWQGSKSYSIEIQIWTLGPVSIFRDGLRYDGYWHRWDKADMLTFWLDENQETPLHLKPGNTWFQVVPLDFQELYVE